MASFRAYDTETCTRSVDAIIAELAARQHGVVERLQLLAAGVTVAEIEGRIRRGLLIRLYRGCTRSGTLCSSPPAIAWLPSSPAVVALC